MNDEIDKVKYKVSCLPLVVTISCLHTIIFEVSRKMAANKERLFILIRPDGVHRGLVGEIIKRFEQKGFKLVAMKVMQVNLT